MDPTNAEGTGRIRKFADNVFGVGCGCGAILFAPALVFIGGCTVISGLPALVHQPTASKLHDNLLLTPRWQLHRIDRLIARAAGDNCAWTWADDSPFLSERGRDMYHSEVGLFATARSNNVNCSSRSTRRSRGVCMMTEGAGFVLSKVEERRAKALRMVHREDELDLFALRDWTNNYCPIRYPFVGY